MVHDFGDWLTKRAVERGETPVRIQPPVREGHWLSIDWVCAALVVLLAVASIVGWVAFERYTAPRDFLQVGAGIGASFSGFIAGVLMLFAGIRGLLSAPRVTVTLVVVFTLVGASLSLLELQQRASDIERERMGELVPDLERKRARERRGG